MYSIALIMFAALPEAIATSYSVPWRLLPKIRKDFPKCASVEIIGGLAVWHIQNEYFEVWLIHHSNHHSFIAIACQGTALCFAAFCLYYL